MEAGGGGGGWGGGGGGESTGKTDKGAEGMRQACLHCLHRSCPDILPAPLSLRPWSLGQSPGATPTAAKYPKADDNNTTS